MVEGGGCGDGKWGSLFDIGSSQFPLLRLELYLYGANSVAVELRCALIETRFCYIKM